MKFRYSKTRVPGDKYDANDATLTFWESWTMAAVSAAFPARMKPTIAVRTIAMRLYVVLDWVSINILEAIARTLGEKSR